jgi:hypothetical protein
MVVLRSPGFHLPKNCDGRVLRLICSSMGRNIHGQPNRGAEVSA